MQKHLLLPLVIAAACGGPTVQQSGVRPAATPANAAGGTITAGDMYARIAFLASDALGGRDTPSQGLEAAAAYVASEFKRLGLEPRGDSGTYFQRYPFTIRTLHGDSTRLTVTTRSETSSYSFGADIFAWAGASERTNGDLVFVGSSMPDADGLQLRDRVPVIYIPGALDRAWRTAVFNARNAARSGGARALVVVLDPAVTASGIRERAALFSTSIAVSPVASTVFLRYDRAREMFKRSGHDLEALVAGAKTERQPPLHLANTSAQIATPVAEVAHRPPNVVAVLPGSDPELRDTYVVLSAHMDHIGIGRPDARGDSINNGADDDASGTSAVLEAAEAFAAMTTRPARSIMFLTVSGEEKGLLGSQYFSDHPVVPLSSIVANINLDMIGRNAPDSIVAIGQDYSSLGPLVQAVVRSHPELGLTVSRDIWPQERFFFRSDHYNFARKEIPAIFFFAGVHDDYHRPSDQVETIDADKAARVAQLAYFLAHEIASRREAPKWTASGLQEVRALTR
jgi:hypothetical protein